MSGPKREDSPLIRDLQRVRSKVSALIAAQRDAERSGAHHVGEMTFRRKVRRRDKVWHEAVELFQQVVVQGMAGIEPAAGGAGGEEPGGG